MRLSIIALFTLSLGAAAALLAARFTGIETHKSAIPTSKVVVVAMPIEAGKIINESHVKLVDWPRNSKPLDVFKATSEAINRVAKVSMVPGEILLPSKLAPISATGGLSSTITEGNRAITVKVNEVIAVAGFALPGSFVDILVNGKDDSGQLFSRTVLSRIKVLAVAQETTADPAKPKVVNAVTLELTPAESEILDLARSHGTLSLTLRNEFDTSEVNSAGARLSDIVKATPIRSPSPSYSETSRTTQISTPATRVAARPVEEIRGTSRQSTSSR